MSTKDVWHGAKCFGSTTVGSRGQVVVPANARKELGIDAGTTLLVFLPPHGQGLLLLKADAVEQMLNIMSRQSAELEKLLKDYKSKAAKKEKRA